MVTANFVSKVKSRVSKGPRIELGSILNASGIRGAAESMSRGSGYRKHCEEESDPPPPVSPYTPCMCVCGSSVCGMGFWLNQPTRILWMSHPR